MSKRHPTHYEALGVDPSAKHHEIGLAFNRAMAARRREDAPPDPKGEVRLREAHAVLSDPERRAAYDESLRIARLKPAFGPKQGAMAAAFVAMVGAGVWWSLAPEPAPPQGRSIDEIRETVAAAVGRLRSIEMSGESRPVGLAFAVEAHTMVTSCHGVSPAAILDVTLPQRELRVRVATVSDELGLCKLAAPDTGSWRLPVSPVPAKMHDKVHAAGLDAQGRVVLRQGYVTRVATDGGKPVLEADMPVAPEANGAPLLDMQGRVVAVAVAPAGGRGWYVPLTPAWVETPKVSPGSTPATERPVEGEAPVDPAAADPAIPGGVPISPERRQRLEKAFRPPPTIPDDV